MSGDTTNDDNVVPNTNEAIEFLKQWPAGMPHLTAIHIDPETKQKGLIEARAFTTPVKWDEVRAWIDARQGKANLYFTVNGLLRPIHKKALKTDMSDVVALHVDIDVPSGEDQDAVAEKLVERILSHDPPPSVVIMSGGGAQAFWILNESDRLGLNGDEAACEQAERYTRGLEDSFSSERGAKADRCHNVDRIMRLPGTINVPDAKKVEKGRKPALAKLVLDNYARTYPLSTFKQADDKNAMVPIAPGAQPGAGGAAASAPKNGRINVRLDWDEIDKLSTASPIDINDLRAAGVEEHALLSLQYGDNLGKLHTYHANIGHRVSEGQMGSYSEVFLAIATSLLKAGLGYSEAASVLKNPNFGGTKHVQGKAKESEKRRAIERAIGKAAGDLALKAAREAATRAGMPMWRDCKDEAGLYPAPTMANAIIGVEALGIRCSYDMFHDKMLLSYDGSDEQVLSVPFGEYSDNTLMIIRDVIDRKWRFDPLEKNLFDAVRALALRNKFDPILDYLQDVQTQWDGVPRLDTWVMKYLGCEDTPLNRAIGCVTLIGAVRRARQPGCKFDTITVLEGPEGTRKSGVIEALAGKENFSDQTILGVSDKEAQELLGGVWLFECAELSGMGRKDVEHVKAFATRTIDRARKAWGRNVEWQARRCILLATTNDKRYLLSQTGNRRFLPLETTVIDLEGIIADRDQLWAEAAYREAAGESQFLDASLWAAANEAQEERRVTDPWEDTLAQMPVFVTESDGVGRQDHRILWPTTMAEEGDVLCVATSTILNYVLRLPASQQTPVAGKRVANIMERIGWKRKKNGLVQIQKNAVRGYFRAMPSGWKEEMQRTDAVSDGKGARDKNLGPGARGLGSAPEGGDQNKIPF
jgi:hypothetical protein